MTTITIQAVYRGGVLQPVAPLNLPDGARVEVQITPVTSPAKPTAFGSLAGIWSHLPEAAVEQMEQAVADARRQSAEKIERLAREVDHQRNIRHG